jgi:hypothetical protein
MKQVPLFLIFLAFVNAVSAQKIQQLGSFGKPPDSNRSLIGENFYLIYDSDVNQVMGFENLNKDAIAFHTFNADFSPHKVTIFSIDSLPFNSLVPKSSYVQGGEFLTLVGFEKRGKLLTVGNNRTSLAVVSYNLNSKKIDVHALEAIEDYGSPREILCTFAHQKHFWVLTYHDKRHLLELHKFSGDKLVDVRKVMLSQEHLGYYTASHIRSSIGRWSVDFAKESSEVMPEKVFKNQIGAVGEELVLFRACPLNDKLSNFFVHRFSTKTTDVSFQSLYFAAASSSSRNICLYENKLLFSTMTTSQLKIEVRTLEDLDKSLITYKYSASDSAVLKLKTRINENQVYWSVEKNKSFSNPFDKFSSGNDISLFAFKQRAGDLIIGYLKLSYQGAVPGYSLSIIGRDMVNRSYSLALRLDPETFALRAEPNGPIYDKLSKTNEELDKLRKEDGAKPLARIMLKDGSELVVRMNAIDYTYRVVRVIPD